MSKVKSKFRPQNKSIDKSFAPQVWCVDVSEYEAGWGTRRDELLEFSSEEEARIYVEKFNKESTRDDTDSHFYRAVAFPKDDLYK